MDFIVFVVAFLAWMSSILIGFQHVSVLCAILNFAFPPLSQLVFAIGNPVLRPSFFCMCIFGAIFYVYNIR